MAESGDEKITKGKIEFCKNPNFGKTSSIVLKGTFTGGINVAVKIIPRHSTKLTKNEFKKLVKRVDHENVVKYYCMEQDDKFCYIAMQLCSCNLKEYIEKKGNCSPGLPNTPVEEILRAAAEGLSHIHQKDIIHRAIKPSNILLFVKYNKLVAKISDLSISRSILDDHTVSDNSSAGTNVNKASKLRTPAFSWRSDVCAFGLVVFYVLSKGKHLSDGNVSQINENNPVNLKELNRQPAALSLVKWLTAFDQAAIPTMTEVVHHPFFWNDEKKLNFIKDVHQITDNKENVPLINEVIEEDSHHVICSSLKNCGNACANWKRHLEDVVIKSFRGEVNEKSCADLVRIIRNKLTHFHELKGDAKAAYGGNIESFRRYWMERFPSLVVHLWEKVGITHLTALLSGYFAPESVHRRNEETTVLRAVDEDDPGKLQGLQIQVNRLGRKIWEKVLNSPHAKEFVEVLFTHGTGTDIEIEIFVITTLLCIAATYGHVEIAQLLIGRGAEVNSKDVDGKTPLHEAACHGHLEVAKLLIKHGAEVKCTDKFGRTPLHHAARKGHLEVAKLPIGDGAEVNCKNDDGKTPLHEAAVTGHSAVAQLLIRDGAEVNCKSENGETPLHEAAVTGHLEVAQLLIRDGAEVNCKSENGETPLHEAAENGHSVVAQLLIERGAEVKCIDKFGRTPLHHAARKGHLEVAKLLIGDGAEVNSKDVDGKTPLHEAACHGHLEVAKLLIKHEAEVNCKDKSRRTPYVHAVQNSHEEMIELLCKHPGENPPSEPNT